MTSNIRRMDGKGIFLCQFLTTSSIHKFQVWYFMLQYLASVQARNMNIVECLNFLFQLSFATIGKVTIFLLPSCRHNSFEEEILTSCNRQSH